MIRNALGRGAIWLALLLLVIPGWALPFQGKSKQSNQSKSEDQKDKEKNKEKQSGQDQTEKPAEQEPLFGGKLGLRSSHHTSDSASLGFNGIGPDGQVEKKFMDANATSDDQAKAQKVAAYKVSDADLKAFLAEGKLNPKSAAQ